MNSKYFHGAAATQTMIQRRVRRINCVFQLPCSWTTQCISPHCTISREEAGRRAHQLRQAAEINERKKCDGKYTFLGKDYSNHHHNNNNNDNNHNNNNNNIHMETILSHAGLSSNQQTENETETENKKNNQNNGHNQNQNQNEPLSPPLHLASTYERPPDGVYGEHGRIYSRTHNPTRQSLEDIMSHLEMVEGGPKNANQDANNNNQNSKAVCAAFSSGMAAASSLLLSLSNVPKIHVILPDDAYHGIPTALLSVLNSHRGITHSVVDMTNVSHVQNHVHAVLRNTSSNGGNGISNTHNFGCQEVEDEDEDDMTIIVLWMESPSNPLCKITDIQAICSAVKELVQEEEDDGYSKNNHHKESPHTNIPSIITVVDSTWAPPYITQPLLLGADAVLHSGTKYIGGHSDVLLGLVTTSPLTQGGRYLGPKLKTVQSHMGSVASSLDCWLALRGLRTLHLRLRRQCRTAMDLATFLDSHPLVRKVHYPGLVDHPQHGVACHQMSCNMFGGMLSFEVEDDVRATAVAAAVYVAKRATSLGGTETLVEHRASIEPADRVTSPPGLLRVSVGLESVHDLKKDLDTALHIAHDVCSV